jgi:tRNA (guanine-N7-)-methyltransferase
VGTGFSQKAREIKNSGACDDSTNSPHALAAMDAMAMSEQGAARRRPLFGRAKGKTLRAHHAGLVANLLPRLEVSPAKLAAGAPLFDFPAREFWLEIGFGGGEHLVARAEQNPDVGFIGCEPFINGVAKLLAAIEANALPNIRVRAGDARELIEAAPAEIFSRIFLLYPDPWPKRRQNKRRLVSDGMIGELARVTRPGAELHFATDIDDYAGWTLKRFLASSQFQWRAGRASDWREPWPEWRPTRYETKARKSGRPSAYLTFTRS